MNLTSTKKVFGALLLSIMLAVGLAVGLVPALGLSSQSAWGATNVAQIGTKPYTTVRDALLAATDGQTVQMIANTTERVNINSDFTEKTVTLDLNGYTLTGPDNDGAPGNEENVIMLNTSNVKLTITDSNRSQAHYYTYSSSSAWTINDNATQDAKNAAITLDAVNSTTTDGTLVCVPGGAITGGNRSNNGGGIYVASNAQLTLNGINIIGNTANSGNSGGGVYGNSSSTITCSNCNIVGNAAVEASSSGGYGGGIYSKGKVEITASSKLNYNQASVDGGALYAYGTTATATNSQFVGNSSVRHGGSVHVAKGKTFSANTCTFSNNKATGAYGYGGALYINSETGNVSEVTITDCTFENNNSFASGGGIYNKGTVTITRGSYNSNSAAYGGVIYNDTGTVNITAGSYSNNSVKAGGAGGAIYNEGGTVEITGGTFQNNIAISGGNGSTGGFLYSIPSKPTDSSVSTASSVTITGATIKGNQAHYGGAISNAYGTATSEISIVNCTITSNSATGAGGGIYNMGTMSISGSSITSCTANIGGGISNYNNPKASLTIQNCDIVGNTADTTGGGVYYSVGSMGVSGTTKITGNTKGTVADNVYLTSGKTITAKTGSGTNEDPYKYLESGALIGVSTEVAPTGTSSETSVAITGTNSQDYSQYFVSDSSSYFIDNGSDNTVMLKKADSDKAPTAAASISLNDSIAVNFYITPKTTDGAYPASSIYVKRTTYHNGTTVSEDPWLLTNDEYTTQSGNAYRFVADKAAAAEMIDNLKVELFYKNGENYEKVKEYTYSVRQYCNAKINAYSSSTDEKEQKLVALCKATLDYGSAAQLYFNKKTTDLANGKTSGTWLDTTLSSITADTLASYNVASVDNKLGVTIDAQASLLLESATTIRFYLFGSMDTSKYTFTLDGTEVAAADIKPTSSPLAAGYYIDKGGIGSADLDDRHTLVVTAKSDATKTLTITYSGLSYAYAQLNNTDSSDNLKNVCRALYLYWQKAYAYFNPTPA